MLSYNGDNNSYGNNVNRNNDNKHTDIMIMT